MADRIRHDPAETARLAKRMGEHADHLEKTAGEHTRNVRRKLGKTGGKDALASAASKASGEILNVIKQAERELRQHLRTVQTGLDHVSNNHHKNDTVLAGKISEIHKRSEDQVKKLRADADRVQAPDTSKPPVKLTLQWKDSMPRPAFARKAQQLAGMSRRGELYKATNPVLRDSRITDQYKSALIHIIYNRNRNNPELRDEAIRVAAAMNPDHVQDLQVGGLDHWENVKMLHAKTNNEIGWNQIWRKIQSKSIEPGTPIKIRVKWK